MALLPYMLLQAIDAVVRSTTEETTVCILNKSPLKEFVCIVVVEMMNSPVTENCSEYFAFLRIGNNKKQVLACALYVLLYKSSASACKFSFKRASNFRTYTCASLHPQMLCISLQVTALASDDT